MTSEGMKVPEEAIQIVDRADGVAGSFCIRRMAGVYAEYWNHGKWEAFAQVFKNDRGTAQAIVNLLLDAEAQKKDWKRLNRVFKSTSDKTIDQDMQIATLTAERDRMREALEIGLDAVSDAKGWGTYNRMEGCDLYSDISKFKGAARAALSEAPKEGR